MLPLAGESPLGPLLPEHPEELLVGIALRLLRVRDVPVGDLLPALVVAPLLTQLVVVLR